MSSISNSIYGSSTNKGVGGLLSGLDTDDLVKQMTAGTRNKINRQFQAKQKLLYRQEAYREISSKLLKFSDTYFSYSSGSKTNILSPKFFEAYTYKSSSSYVNVSGNAENIKNFSIDNITSVATAASFTSSKKVSGTTFNSEEITEYTSTIAGATFSLEYNNKTYNLAIDKGFGNAASIEGISDEDALKKVVDQLNKQLAKIEGNEENINLKYKVGADNTIVFETGTAKLTAASSAFTENLNMKVGEVASSDTIQVDKLTKESKEIFKDSHITFDFNGITKTINLTEKVKVPTTDGSSTEEIDLNSAESLKRYLEYELDKSYGAGKVDVIVDGNKLSFEAVDSSTNLFGISSISSALSNFTGLESGDYNRVNKTKPLLESGITGIKDIKEVKLDNDKQGYFLNINGANIEFESTMSITDVINKINSNADAGVRAYYSSTTNTFTLKATEAGEHNKIEIDYTGDGNLASVLFGTTGKAGEQFTNVESLLDSKLKLTDNKFDSYKYNKTKNEYELYKKDTQGNDVLVGTASLGTGNKVTIKYKTPEITEEVQLVNYIVDPGTDTEITYTLNGVQNTIKRSSANFTIDEINIELNEKAVGATKDAPVTFDVTNNVDEVVERVKKFVDDYNEIINLVSTKTSEKPNRDYLPLTPEQQEEMEESEIKNWNEEAKKGSLYADSKMNTVLRRLRLSMTGLTDVSSLTLSNIGIASASMDTSGKLVFDETKFKEKLLENPDEIANMFTHTSSKTGTDAKSGIALQIQQILRDNVGAYGTSGLLIEEAGMINSMTSDSNNISLKVKEYDEKMKELKRDLETERSRYWKQFSSLEQSLNKLNSQSSWLTDMMGGQ